MKLDTIYEGEETKGKRKCEWGFGEFVYLVKEDYTKEEVEQIYADMDNYILDQTVIDETTYDEDDSTSRSYSTEYLEIPKNNIVVKDKKFYGCIIKTKRHSGNSATESISSGQKFISIIDKYLTTINTYGAYMETYSRTVETTNKIILKTEARNLK